MALLQGGPEPGGLLQPELRQRRRPPWCDIMGLSSSEEQHVGLLTAAGEYGDSKLAP